MAVSVLESVASQCLCPELGRRRRLGESVAAYRARLSREMDTNSLADAIRLLADMKRPSHL